MALAMRRALGQLAGCRRDFLGQACAAGVAVGRPTLPRMRPAGTAPASALGARGGARAFASGKDSKDEVLLDSWVCPDALYEATMGGDEETSLDVDQQFIHDFGRRNEVWRQRVLRDDPDLFTQIKAGQSPKYLWIGCSDSRVAAENMIDARPGEIFVHRNVANLVVNTDFNVRAVLKYAIEYLKVEHVIVCGHYDCGGVKAAFKNLDHGDPLESWLACIRDVYRYHQEELEAIINEEERHKRFVELNVVEQCLNLFKTSDVQRRRAHTGSRPDKFDCAFPRVHAMVFEPSDGILRRLPIDWKEYIKKYRNVYQLYDADDFVSSYEGA